MPADPTLPSITDRHGNASEPYPCSRKPAPPGGAPFIDFGYCRTSLDWHPPREVDGQLVANPQGANDPRCPANCQHKAPERVAIGFMQRFPTGVVNAAQWVKDQISRS